MTRRADPRARWSGLARAHGAALLLAAGAAGAAAQEPERAPEAPREDPRRALELAIGGDGLALGYRNAFHRGSGYNALGFLANEDDDLALHGRLMRFGEPFSETPLAFGVGLGALVAYVDGPDAELAAAQVIGAAEYELALEYPVRVLAEVAYSPDIATFADSTRTLDVVGRVEVDLSSWATGFGGYRLFEVDLEDEEDAELDRAFHAGVRLGF